MSGQLRLKLEQPARYDRDRLIVSAANEEAVRLLDRWPRGGSGALALIGPAGSGKTHIARSWAQRVGAVLLAHEDLGPTSALRPVRPLLLEDADQIPAGEGLFHLMNHAALPGACLLITGRTPPSRWPVEIPDLRSRVNALPVVEVFSPDDAILSGMLVKLFQERNIRPPPDLIAYLLRRIERSASAAATIVRALDEAAQEEQRPVSRVLARQLLQDDQDEAPRVHQA